MISLLAEEEQHTITKHSLIELECEILFKLGFDFNFPGPYQSLERFLRILDYDQNRTIMEMAFQICKYQLNDANFLDYRPSQIAACCLIIAINIHERDLKKKSQFFSSKSKGSALHKLNTDIWN